jgi:bifunctional UDP-N-acetylglucosamine pyrophosphorylase/glucosamine-1-phosphate N-acetyltransferase
VKAFLLLAGRSKRFWPLTDKCLFPICGKTLAEHQVDMLKKGGVRDITLIVGAHNKKELKKLFPTLKIVEQKDLDLGMQGACMSGLKGVKEPVMIVSGNDVIEPSAFDLLRKEMAKPGVDGAILARKVTKYFPGGYLSVKAGRSMAIVEKPGEGKEPSKLVNIVAHVHKDPVALLQALKSVKNHRDDGYELALHALFAQKNYRAVAYEGFWQPVKYPWHLLPLLEYFLSKIEKPLIHKTAKIHPTAVVEGNVVIGEGTRILAHASVVGPCTIGARCIIGNNALVRGSSVGDDSVVGYSTEVKGSLLAGPVWTHMSYLGDSIIGRNVSFGAGCLTGNLRLDEGEIADSSLTKLGLVVGDNCRFGIQVGTNPGVKIGAGTFVAGAVFVTEDVADKSFVTMKDGKMHIRENKSAAPSMEERAKYRKKV